MPVTVREQLLLDAFVALAGEADKTTALRQVIDRQGFHLGSPAPSPRWA